MRSGWFYCGLGVGIIFGVYVGSWMEGKLTDMAFSPDRPTGLRSDAAERN